MFDMHFRKSFKNEGIRSGILLANNKGKVTKVTLKDRIQEIEREEIVKALKECDWVMARAARRLGITERMIGYKIRKHGLRIKEVKWVEEPENGEAAAGVCK